MGPHTRTGYIAIENTLHDDETFDTPGFTVGNRPASTSILALFLLCLVSLAVSILNTTAFLTSGWLMARSGEGELKFPNLYIGLERLNLSNRVLAMPPRSNWPLLMTTASRNQSNAANFDKNRFLLNPVISMIVQFRVNDFGLESCAIQSVIPYSSHLQSKTYDISGDTSSIAVWRVTDESLQPRILTWGQKPSRTALLGTLDLTPGTNSSTPWFHCPAGSLQTFELACGSPSCRIEFKQDRSSPLLAIQMFQRAEVLNRDGSGSETAAETA